MKNLMKDRNVVNPFAALGIRGDLVGEPYINWIRCSGMGQVDTSPEGQKDVNDAYAAAQRMRWSGYDVYAEAVSGSQTFNREDIQEILHLKRTRNDFTKVIVFELGRATRGGIRHSNEVETEFRRAGIELISSTELIPDGPVGDLIKAVKAFSNQQQAMNISKSVARGLAQSLAKASRPSAGRTPYGLDRLYIGPDGSPRALIRWSGLVQLRLEPMTQQVISQSARQPNRRPRRKGMPGSLDRRKRFIGYKKQDDERSKLVAGSSDALNTVITILRMFHNEDRGAHRIIQYLRDSHIPSPTGGDWNMSSIRYIVENPIYIGKEVRHRWTRSLYHMLGPDGPVPVDVDQDLLQVQGRVSVPQVERGRDQWVLVDKPELMDLLPPDVRGPAIKYLAALYDADAVVAKQARRGKRKNKHDDNPYVLGQLLHSKQTGHPMRGDTNTKRTGDSVAVRRYYFDYSTASKAISGLHARRVRAESLEDAVVTTVFAVLRDGGWVDRQVRDYVDQVRESTPNAEACRSALVAERDEVARRLKRIHKTSGHLTDEELEVLVHDDNARLVAIRHELSALDQAEGRRPPTADEAAAAVAVRLAALPENWRSLPNRELKLFLNAVIEVLRIDLVTLDVELSLRLPEEATAALPEPDENDEGRVRFRSAWSFAPDATATAGIQVERVTCSHEPTTKRHLCRRVRPAA